MHSDLLRLCEAFVAKTGVSEWTFGFKAVKNGRLIERLRNGDKIWPHTEAKVRIYIAEREPDLMPSRQRKASPVKENAA